MGVVDIVLVLVGNVLDVKKKNTNNGMIEMKACKLCDENGKIKERGLCADCSDYSDEQIIKFKLAEEIQKAEEDVRYKKKEFLRLHGWATTSSFPDAHWRWVKSVKGVTLALSLNEAYSVEQAILHYKN